MSVPRDASPARTLPVFVGVGKEMFLTRPEMGREQLLAVHRDWARWSTRRARSGAVVAALAFVGVAAVVGASLVMLTGAPVVAALAAAGAGAGTAALARAEVQRSYVWQHGENVLPLSAADRILGAKMNGSVEPARQHVLLWILAGARQELAAAEARCASTVAQDDAEVLELLSEDLEQARLRLARVLGRMRELTAAVAAPAR